MPNENGNNSTNDGSDVTGLGLGNDTLLDNNKGGTNNNQSGTQNNNGASNQNSGTTTTTSTTTTPVDFEGKSYQTDEKGNLLNDDKTIFKTKEDVEKAKNTSNNSNQEFTAVNLDGKDYKLDKDGNALGEDGKIFKTKSELDEIEANDKPLVLELAEKAGIVIKDEKGNPKVYEDTPEGILQWNNDVAEVKAKALNEKFLNENAETKKYHDFLKRGGSPEEYFGRKASSWKGVKLDEKDETQLISVVKADLIASGQTEEQADFIAKTYKDTDKLKEYGKIAYNKLVKYEDDLDAYEAQQHEANEKQRIEDNTKYWNSINETINKGTLQNITIPENERVEFFKFISQVADDKGNTQAMINRAKASKETLLAIEYLFYKGLDLNKLITNTAQSQNVRTLRSRVSRSQQGLGGGHGVNKDNYKSNNNDDSVSLDVIT